MERELVKIKSDNPAYPNGYFTQFKDMMKPGDVVYGTKPVIPETKPAKPETIAVILDEKTIKHKPAEPKPIKRKVRK